jgi:hypothetical protein
MVRSENRESRGRRPRLSCKEEKKRFRPSESENTAADRQSLVGCLTPTLRNPYAGHGGSHLPRSPPHAPRLVARSFLGPVDHCAHDHIPIGARTRWGPPGWPVGAGSAFPLASGGISAFGAFRHRFEHELQSSLRHSAAADGRAAWPASLDRPGRSEWRQRDRVSGAAVQIA